MKIKLTVLLLTLFSVSFGQTKIDNWYKFERKNVIGYLHHTVEEDSLSFRTTLDFKFKKNDDLRHFHAQIHSKKDTLLTVTSFEIVGPTDDHSNPEKIKIVGNVYPNHNHLTWVTTVNDRKREKETQHPTITDWNLYQVLTMLDYSKKGIILEFNLMEISELNYKENHYLEYLEDEVLEIDGQKINTKKITHNGDGIRGSTYWLDDNHTLVKISIDNYKNYTKCQKEAIDFEEY